MAAPRSRLRHLLADHVHRTGHIATPELTTQTPEKARLGRTPTTGPACLLGATDVQVIPIEQQRLVRDGGEVFAEEVADPASAVGDAEQRRSWCEDLRNHPAYALQEGITHPTDVAIALSGGHIRGAQFDERPSCRRAREHPVHGNEDLVLLQFRSQGAEVGCRACRVAAACFEHPCPAGPGDSSR
jgi:hypothetical protein